MKEFDLTKVEDLNLLKEELNNVIETKIETAALNEKVKDINKFNIGVLKNIFENISERLYDTKKGKTLIGKYTKTLSENSDLRKIYLFYESINKPLNLTNTELFINESLKITQDIDKKNYTKSLNELATIIKNSIYESKISAKELDEIINNKKEINETIDFLIKNKKNMYNMNEYVNNFEKLNSFIKENVKNEETIVEENKDFKTLLKDYHNLFENNFSEWENKAIKDISLIKLNGSDKSILFEEYKKECLDILDNIINEDIDDESLSNFTSMREKLSEKEYREENFVEDILKLSELKYTLNE